MWILFAFLSAFFAGLTSILAKCGIRKTDSHVATALRTAVVLIFSWVMVGITGSFRGIADISANSLIFLLLSGLATGVSWLCYFRALQLGDVNKVVPIDKFSGVLTILFACLFLGEPLTWLKAIALLLIAAGTLLMIQKKESVSGTGKPMWLIYALLSAVFAALTSILAKVGINGISSNLATAIRTCVVLCMSWLLVLVTGKAHTVRNVPGKELIFIVLSGFATGASWLCYYKALSEGPAGTVASIDKLSIFITIVFSYLVFKEKLTKKAWLGLALLAAGTFAMLF